MGDVVKYKISLHKLWKKAISENVEIKICEGYISLTNDLGECCYVEID